MHFFLKIEWEKSPRAVCQPGLATKLEIFKNNINIKHFFFTKEGCVNANFPICWNSPRCLGISPHTKYLVMYGLQPLSPQELPVENYKQSKINSPSLSLAHSAQQLVNLFSVSLALLLF